MESRAAAFAQLLQCPLCAQLISNPYTTASCLHTFCQYARQPLHLIPRKCIVRAVRFNCKCPQCQAPILIKELRRSPMLSTIIACIRKLDIILESQPSAPSHPPIKTPASELRALKLRTTPSSIPSKHVAFQDDIREPEGRAEKRSPALARSPLTRSTPLAQRRTRGRPAAKLAMPAGRLYVLLLTGLDDDQKELIKSAYEHLSKTKPTLRSSYTANVTHIITKADHALICGRTDKYMRGIVDGKIIVSYDWFLASVSAGHFVDETPFLIKGDDVVGRVTNAVSRSIQGHGMGPEGKLFSGLQFYLMGAFTRPSREEVVYLITAGGGKMHTRKPRAASPVLIVFQDGSNESGESQGNGKIHISTLLLAISEYSRDHLLPRNNSRTSLYWSQ